MLTGIFGLEINQTETIMRICSKGMIRAIGIISLVKLVRIFKC